MNLIEQYQQMHDQGQFAGLTVLNFEADIQKLIDFHAPVDSLLDYGCGKAAAYTAGNIHLKWGVSNMKLYDPGTTQFAAKPKGLYDGVICCDVLEHIPEDELNGFIKTVLSHAEKFAFLTVCPREAQKKLPDGRNCHLTVKPLEWWEEKIHFLARTDLDVQIRENP